MTLLKRCVFCVLTSRSPALGLLSLPPSVLDSQLHDRRSATPRTLPKVRNKPLTLDGLRGRHNYDTLSFMRDLPVKPSPKAVLFTFLLSALAAPSWAQITFTAASCKLADVQAAINAELSTPADGDVIVIPSGTCTWTGSTQVSASFTTSVTIQGAGAISATDGGAGTTGTDQTVIIDNINYASGPSQAIYITTAAGKSFRLTGIAISQNSSSTVSNSAIVEIQGTSTSVRVDHCHFAMLLSSYDVRFDGPLGVVDHNYFSGAPGSGYEPGGLAFHLSTTADPLGDQPWAAADQFGTANFVYVEDCRFYQHSLGDSHDGGRYVFRHNVFQSPDSTAPQMANHGLTGSRGRSMRAAEIYLNTFTETYSVGVGQPTYSNNGGTTLYWGNTLSGYRHAVIIAYTRQDNSTYGYGTPPSGWGNCSTSGGNGWDQNAVAPSGYACLDQPGRGAGDLLSGYFPTVCNQTRGCSTYNGQWARQALSPIYVWGNTFTPAIGYSPTLLVKVQSALVTENQDYYQQFGTNAGSGSFDGTKGIGQGLLSARPSTCTAGPGGNTPGIGYWATDTNTLYVCNPTNTWNVYYTPYTYPHPLTGSSGTVLAPTNLTSTVH